MVKRKCAVDIQLNLREELKIFEEKLVPLVEEQNRIRRAITVIWNINEII